MLESHYRSQSKFSWESLEAAQNRLKDLHAWADLRHQTSVDVMPDDLDQLFKQLREGVQQALENDLNTPTALTSFNDIMSYMANISIPSVEGKYTDGTLAFLDAALGLQLGNRPDINDEQKSLIAQREEARSKQDWAKSDELRNKLTEQGIGLRDTAHGAIWYRI